MNTLRALIAGFSVCVAAGALARVPAHYLVFNVDRAGNVSLVSRSEVMLDARPASDPISFDDAAVEHVTLRAANFHKAVPVDRLARVEWSDPLTGEMQSRTAEQNDFAFVVRVPDDAGAMLTAEHSSGRSMTVDLHPLAAALSAPVSTSANSANRLDILIMGDGYRSAEQTKFESDAANVATKFFTLSPYFEYRNYMQTSTLFVPSNQSGADHPNCPESDPKSPAFVDTAFDATYCSSGLQRLLTVSLAKVYTAAAAAPDWDKILVIVNDTTYGGSGGAVLVGSLDSSSVDVIRHEFGHTFGLLADEYSTPYPGYPSCSDLVGLGCEPNVTDQTSRGSIKWNAWINSSTPVPTSGANLSVVGLFPGARYQSSGLYRPKYDCLMNHLGAQFCEICKQSLILRLYRGFGGSPVNGIDMIEPGSEFPSPSSTIHTTAGESLVFSFSLLQPAGGAPATIAWTVDGIPQFFANTPSFLYRATAGTHTISVSVTDQTNAVRDSSNALRHTRTWTVSAPPAVVPPKRRAAPH